MLCDQREPKKGGGWRVCVFQNDIYRYLNKNCIRGSDNYPFGITWVPFNEALYGNENGTIWRRCMNTECNIKYKQMQVCYFLALIQFE